MCMEYKLMERILNKADNTKKIHNEFLLYLRAQPFRFGRKKQSRRMFKLLHTMEDIEDYH